MPLDARVADEVTHADREVMRCRFGARAHEIGVRAASREVGLSREAFLSVIAGVARKGTWLQAQLGFRRLLATSPDSPTTLDIDP